MGTSGSVKYIVGQLARIKLASRAKAGHPNLAAGSAVSGAEGASEDEAPAVQSSATEMASEQEDEARDLARLFAESTRRF